MFDTLVMNLSSSSGGEDIAVSDVIDLSDEEAPIDKDGVAVDDALWVNGA